MKRLGSIVAAVAIAVGGTLLFSPGATAAPAPYAYFNGFENVNDTSPPAPANSTEAVIDATRVASGTGGIASSTGSWYGSAAVNSGAFSRLGGYSLVFPTGGYTTSADIYLDVAQSTPLADLRFDWSSAISRPDLDLGGLTQHRRDFVFNVGTDGLGGFVMTASNNAGRGGANPADPGRSPFTVTTSGWYTFTHHFYDNGSGVLAVDMTISDSSGVLHSWTLSDPSDVIGTTVGGNRYSWLVNNELPLALDTINRSGIASADLSVSKADSPDPAHVGQKLTYTILVTNNGPDSATGVTLTDTLPKSTGFGSVSTTQGTCTRAKQVVSCNIGPLASGATATVTIVVKPTQKGTITNTVTVAATSPNDPNTANNTATTPTLVKP